ncbi:activator of HSP90 ATPase, partial [Streptomyces sp. Tu 6176]
DTYHGRFVRRVPGEQVVEEAEFETDGSASRGTVTPTTTLTDAGGGTAVLIAHRTVAGPAARRQRVV